MKSDVQNGVSRRRRCSVVTLDAKLLIARTGLLFAEESRGKDDVGVPLRWADGDILERDVVIKTSNERSSALFDQIESCLKEVGQGKVDDDAVYNCEGVVTKWLVYLDFTSLFGRGGLGKSDEDDLPTAFEIAAQYLVDNGFSVEDADNEGRVWHYTIFDKSANQARHSVISFIADEGYDAEGNVIKMLNRDWCEGCGCADLDRRLCLGIDFAELNARVDAYNAEHEEPKPLAKAEWSKYFAYRGLYLSTATRMDDPALALNKETVLVLGPIEGSAAESELEAGVLQIGDYEEDGPMSWRDRVRIVDSFRSKMKLFDGEGLISPAYAEILRNCRKKENASTFQIRMPFAKGLLHEVDFHSFLRDELGIGEGAKITDAFGLQRDLNQVQIVLTAEMLKCLGWLKSWKVVGTAEDWQLPEGSSEERDPMAYYFEQFKHYEHGLYVNNTDAGLDKSDVTSLNGQFLSTLLMDEGEFDEFVRTRMKKVLSALDDADEARKLLIGSAYDDADWEDDGDDADGTDGDAPLERSTNTGGDPIGAEAEFDADDLTLLDAALLDYGIEDQDGGLPFKDPKRFLPTWKLALMKSKRFLYDPYVQSKLKSYVGHKFLSCARGDLDAAGRLFYLSHDLLRLLVEIAMRTDTNPLSKQDAESWIGKNCMPPARFHAPALIEKRFDSEECWFDDGSCWFGMLRNPHLSRSEQCALRLHDDGGGLYRKYFGHLSGIAMVACDSVVPVTLGGADFDGDAVRVFWEKAVVKAILDGAYIKSDGKSGGSPYRRRYPVVEMEGPKIEPGANEADEVRESLARIGKHISYEQLRLTFSSRIGMISNSAMRKARDAYSAHPDKNGEGGSLPEQDECAIYSVATGMEIDSVKTGMDLTDQIRDIYVKPEGQGRDKFGYISFRTKAYDSLAQASKPLVTSTYTVKEKRDERKGDGDDAKKISLLSLEHKTNSRWGFKTPNYAKYSDSSEVFDGMPVANIDRLPWLLLDERRKWKKSRKKTPKAEFSFEEHDAWAGDLIKEPKKVEKLLQVQGLLKIYRYMRNTVQSFKAEQRRVEARNEFAKACNLVRVRPQAGNRDRADGDARLRDALLRIKLYFEEAKERPKDNIEGRNEIIEDVLADLGGVLADLNGFKEGKAKKRPKDNYKGWAFCAPKKRKAYLDDLMPGFLDGLSDSAKDETDANSFYNLVVQNDQRGGYMVLYYLLAAVERDELLRREFDPAVPKGNDLRPPEPSRKLTDVEESLFEFLAELSRTCLREKSSQAEWNDGAATWLRFSLWNVLKKNENDMQDEDDMPNLLRCLVFFRQSEKNRPDRQLGKDYEWKRAPLRLSGGSDEGELFWALLDWQDVEEYIEEDEPIRLAE